MVTTAGRGRRSALWSATQRAAAAPAAPTAALHNGVGAPLALPAAAPPPWHKVGDALEVRCEDDGQWYQAVIESEHHGTFFVSYSKDGYEYHSPLGIWRAPKRRGPWEPLEVRCKDDGRWYPAVVESQDDSGPTRVRFEKDGYAYHYPLSDWRVRGARSGQEAQEGREAPRATALQDLKEGQAVRGRVVRITDFGFFADIGAERPGLVHKNLIPGNALQVSDVVSLDQELELWVSRVDGNSSVALSMVSPLALESFQGVAPDHWLQGVVTAVQPLRILVRVQPPSGGEAVTGFVPVSNISTGFVKSPEDVVTVGQAVTVRVTCVDKGGVRLSMLSDPSAFRDTPPDQWLPGVVVGFADFGAFVDVRPPAGGPACQGLVHISEIGDNFVARPEDWLSVGQEVAVRVLDTKVSNELALSMRPAEAPPDCSAFQGLPSDHWLPGVVKQVVDFGAFVEVPPPDGGPACRGLVHRSLLSPEDQLTVGQELPVRVLNATTDRLDLSPRKADHAPDLSAFHGLPADHWLSAVVEDIKPFGAFVSVRPPSGGPACRGLLHRSEISDDFVASVEEWLYVGQEVAVRVLDARTADRLDLSMRPAPAHFSAFRDLPPDHWLPGVVKQVVDFGAFVEVRLPTGGPACRGMVHRSEISSDFVASVEGQLSVGQEVAVRVLDAKIDKLYLSMRPDLSAFQDLPPDHWLPGVVTQIVDFGAFVEVPPPAGGPACRGLVHRSRVSPEDQLTVGQELPVRVLNATADRLVLSASRHNHTTDLSAFRGVSPDKWLPGVVACITDFGTFVDVRPPAGGPACMGFVHISEIGGGLVASPDEWLSVGQEVSVRVLKADNKLDLSMNPLDVTVDLSAFQDLPPDHWLPGVVKQVVDFGAFVEVRPPVGGPACKGFVHRSEISDDFVGSAEDRLSVGQEVSVRVLGTKAANKLPLSMRPPDVPADLSAFQGLPPDCWLPGVVKRIEDFGAFVEVRPPAGGPVCTGLVHLSEFKRGRVQSPDEELAVGQEVAVRVLAAEAGRLSLSLRPAP